MLKRKQGEREGGNDVVTLYKCKTISHIDPSYFSLQLKSYVGATHFYTCAMLLCLGLVLVQLP